MKKSSAIKVLLICNNVLYVYHTANKLICWINVKEGPFAFAKIDVGTFLSCAATYVLMNVVLFHWQGTTVVIVLL